MRNRLKWRKQTRRRIARFNERNRTFLDSWTRYFMWRLEREARQASFFDFILTAPGAPKLTQTMFSVPLKFEGGVRSPK